jgi:hypothetical protein
MSQVSIESFIDELEKIAITVKHIDTVLPAISDKIQKGLRSGKVSRKEAFRVLKKIDRTADHADEHLGRQAHRAVDARNKLQTRILFGKGSRINKKSKSLGELRSRLAQWKNWDG